MTSLTSLDAAVSRLSTDVAAAVVRLRHSRVPAYVNINEGNVTNAAMLSAIRSAGFAGVRCSARGKMRAACEALKPHGLRFILIIFDPRSELESEFAEFLALSPELKAVVSLIGLGNENWSPSTEGTGPHYSGDEYGKMVVKCGELQRQHAIATPFSMETRLSPHEHGEWLAGTFSSGKAPAITRALIGNGTAARPQNALDEHPYGTSLMVPQRQRTLPPSGQPIDVHDAEGHEWGAQRALQCASYVFRETGVQCALSLSEYGGNGSGKQAQVEHALQFAKIVSEGRVPSNWLISPGYTPKLFALALYKWEQDSEGFGIDYEPILAAVKAGVAALNA